MDQLKLLLVILVGLAILLRLVLWFRGPVQRRKRFFLGDTANRRERHSRRRFLTYRPRRNPPPASQPVVVTTTKPYPFAYRAPQRGTWFDLSADHRPAELERRGLPIFRDPEALAQWLGVSFGDLAWLSHRCTRGKSPGLAKSHYVCGWLRKRHGGYRLIESPKARLKAVQRRLLVDLFQHLPVTDATHGFVPGRSIESHARVHAQSAVILKFDLRDFYLTIRANRLLRLFRSWGYSREVALWLARLTTHAIPPNLPRPPDAEPDAWRYRHRHLPQGAPTSPVLANLVARRLDRRLEGLATAFGARYTRYADDLAFSGDDRFSASLRTFIQLVEQIIRDEGFRANRAKRQVLRPHQRQILTGLVVNDQPHVSRREFDRLKAILHHCVKTSPRAQNTAGHPNYAAHLAGRIAHIARFQPHRGAKLRALYDRIDWNR
jgi:hypothetical protein